MIESSAQPTEPLSEHHITQLVNVFYDRAKAHPELGPLFQATIGDWEGHLQLICDFWSHALMGTQRYKNHAYPAHVSLPIQRQHFDQWLDLFRPSARETLPAEAARRAIARAEHMTESFRAGLFPFDRVKGH